MSLISSFAQAAGTVFPQPNSINVRLNLPIVVVLDPGIQVPDENALLEIRGPKDYFCLGNCSCIYETDATIATFTPASLYLPNSVYSVRVRYVNNHTLLSQLCIQVMGFSPVVLLSRAAIPTTILSGTSQQHQRNLQGY